MINQRIIINFLHAFLKISDKRDVKPISASHLRLLYIFVYLLVLSNVYAPRCRFYSVELHELQPLHFRPFN